MHVHSVRSGSQLKLVIAMRGGPIHAHRSIFVITYYCLKVIPLIVQLEDFAILELAEFLESQ